ncbi:hypothetical protein H4217_001899 [Coemansia sp. RSA 1939]|nr:hypothetical protein H4217_001899 [Coemansia sp. RSA 1939]
MRTRYAVAFAAAQAVGAQFVFDPKTYDSSQLFDLLSGYYEQYAATWENQLTSAKASLPVAYSALTSIFGTDAIPDSFDAEFASHLVSEMLEMGPTTIREPETPGSTATDASTEESKHSSVTATHTSTQESESTDGASSGASTPESTGSEETSSETMTISGINIFTLTSEDTITSGAVPRTRPRALVAVAMAAAMAGVGLHSFF